MTTPGYLTHHVSLDGRELSVQVHHTLDFRMQREFREICQGKQYAKYIIDMGDASYIDSSALGMLMVLHRHVHENRQAVQIRGCTPAVLEILRIAHFQRFFEIPGLPDEPAPSGAGRPVTPTNA